MPPPAQFRVAPEQIWKTLPIRPHGQILPSEGMMLIGELLSLQGHPAGVKHLPVQAPRPCRLMGCCNPHIQFSVWSQIWIFLQMRAKCKVITKVSRIQVLTLSLPKVSASQRCEGRTEPPSSVGSSRDAESTCPSSHQRAVQHHAHLFPCFWCSSSSKTTHELRKKKPTKPSQ